MVEIVELSAELLPVVNRWRAIPDFGGEFDWIGAKRELTEADLADPTRLVILFNGEPVGDLSFHEVHYGPNKESTAYNMGITIDKAFRGRGIGSQAQRLLSDQLLQRVHRVEAQTDVENLAEQRSLEKAGFTREGVLYGAQHRNGTYHDLVSYSRVRSKD